MHEPISRCAAVPVDPERRHHMPVKAVEVPAPYRGPDRLRSDLSGSSTRVPGSAVLEHLQSAPTPGEYRRGAGPCLGLALTGSPRKHCLRIFQLA